MNQFNQMGMQSMGQRSTPPLPMGASGNQVSAELTIYHSVFFFNVPINTLKGTESYIVKGEKMKCYKLVYKMLL